MRFQLDHDWQGNMSTPRARVGDSAKTHLLLLLCVIWITLGLIGHAPWKPLESTSISIVKSILKDGNFIAPLANGETYLDKPPLYYLVAATGAKLLSPLLSMHDGARLFNVFWLTLILLMVGMTGRELWSRGTGRHSAFILMGTIGLVLSAHSLCSEIAGLACLSTGFYALALSKRRPWRASGLLSVALSVGFLSDGVMPFLILFVTCLLLPMLFKAWRTQSFAKVFLTATLIASPIIIIWLAFLSYYYPIIFYNWCAFNLNNFHHLNHLYFMRILIWYAWPALPLALWGLWRNINQLFTKPKFQLIIVFFITSLFLLGLGAQSKDINVLPLLLPLVALGAGSVEHLKRGAAAALNWFGILLFGLLGTLIWLGWFAILTGYPAKIKERMQFLSGLNEIHLNWASFIVAIFITIMWLLVCLRGKQTNKSTVTNWATGMTFSWGLLMTLWLPLVDSAKSYETVFKNLYLALPNKYSCIDSLNVGMPQRLLFNYYTDITIRPIENTQKLGCDLYLFQDIKGDGRMYPGQDWKLVWSGKRAADRKESFRLYKNFKSN